MPERFWRLDDILDGADNPIRPEGGWQVGGIYQHLERADGSPPLYGGFDEQTADFYRLVWTEVGDPRLAVS
jgi:hypothetical protein